MKLNLSFAVTALAALLTAVSCSVDERVPIPPDEDLSVSTVISPDEALDNLDALLVDIYGHTKSGAPSYDPESLSVFGGAVTKSSEGSLPDTSVYIVNFTDESGFAVLAAQRAMSTPVFCVTEAGTLTSEDLYQAIQRLDEASESTSARSSKDSEFVSMMLAASIVNQMSDNGGSEPHPDNPDPDDHVTPDENDGEEGSIDPGKSRWETIKKIGPLLETKWHQESPFNDFLGVNSGKVAGCAAVATGQILVSNRYGSSDGRYFDWNRLKKVCHYSNPKDAGSEEDMKAASDFMEFVGSYKNCRITYGQTSAGNIQGAQRTLRNFGYKNVTIHTGFQKADANRVKTNLEKGRPIYTRGDTKTGDGHAWVIDGFVERNRVLSGEVLESKSYFHVNWGWNGEGDGYYEQGVFDTAERTESDDMDSGEAPSVNYDFNIAYRTLTYTL